MPFALVPAGLAHAADGTPYSEAYGDVYHSAGGGPAQARHVFLGGNGLPARWQGRERFVVLETGFGLGLNFLATWQAWRDDPDRCSTLHYVAVEKHPFTAADLAVLHAPHDELAALSAALRDAWPLLVPGCHRIAFEGGRVVLTLFFADAVDALPQLRLAADAIYLDGFAPARNPDMWSPSLLKRLARLCAPGATAATWTVAGEVRGALAAAGFAVEKRAGFGAKREMLCATVLARPGSPATAGFGARRAMVIGAGIAGASNCAAFAARGWDVTLVESAPEPASAASGNHAGSFHPLLAPDDSVFARLTRAAYLAVLAGKVERMACGVLQLARDEREDESQRRALAALGAPADYAACVDAAQASELAGMRVAAGGLWFARAGVLRPVRLVGSLLSRSAARLQARFGCRVAALEHDGGDWIARDARGGEIARARVAVLANADDALRLAPDPAVRMRRVRGQLTHLPAARFAALRTVVLRGGFVLPPVEGIAVTGASFDFDDEESAPRTADHAHNLGRLERIIPGASAGLDPATLQGRVAWRAAVPDRLPMIGPIEDPRGPGLYGTCAYGSRGLLWAGLGAELVASHAGGEPLPLEAKLLEALAPGRFRRRAARRTAP